MLKIGEFSKLSRVSIRMLRHYDTIGLLKPMAIHPETGYRYYGEEQLPVAGRIAALKEMGFRLSEIAEILPCFADRELLESRLRTKQNELRREFELTAYRLRLLDTACQRLRKDAETMNYDVTLKTFPERYAATVRRTIPCYEQEQMLWDILMEETGRMNLTPGNPCCCCAVFHDEEHRETDVDVEVQKTVTGTYPDTEHVKFRTLPEVTAATAVCRGSYDQMDAVMRSVADWIVRSGYVLNGAVFFIYHVSPYETDNPSEFVTEICYPVRKK